MLTVLSLDHRRTTVSQREPFALPAKEQARLGRIVRRACGGQVAFLVTCNRVELITWTAGDDRHRVLPGILTLGRRLLPGLAERFVALAARYEGAAAERHLFRVAAGLESQIAGDVQVLGQVRDCYAAATQSGTAGPELHRLFQTALRAGKRVHHETGFGRRNASLGDAAAAEVARRMAQTAPGNRTGRHVVLLGAGKAAEGALRALASPGMRVTIINRDRARAEALARAAGAEVAAFEERYAAVAEADAVILATGAPEPILLAAPLRRLRSAGRVPARPILLIDLAVPRNVETAVGKLPGVTVLGLESLSGAGDADVRTHAARRAAEQIIEAELLSLRAWLQSRSVRLAGVA